MSEAQKFTKEEIDQISELRDQLGNIINELGQIEIEFILANQRIESLNTAKEKLQNDYNSAQDTERAIVTKMNEKYGAGTVDLQSGEFIPASWLFDRKHLYLYETNNIRGATKWPKKLYHQVYLRTK